VAKDCWHPDCLNAMPSNPFLRRPLPYMFSIFNRSLLSCRARNLPTSKTLTLSAYLHVIRPASTLKQSNPLETRLHQIHTRCGKAGPEPRECISNPPTTSTSWLRPQFWQSEPHWKRACLNTFRCLIGCTSGDFTALWILQSQFPDIGVAVTMGIASK
jgi:Domain of unknown function (DUF4396)